MLAHFSRRAILSYPQGSRVSPKMSENALLEAIKALTVKQELLDKKVI